MTTILTVRAYDERVLVSGANDIWVQRLRDPARQVREEALRQLEALGDPRALGAVARVFAADPEPELRTMARQVGKAIYYAALKRASSSNAASEVERQRAADILAKAQSRKRRQRRR